MPHPRIDFALQQCDRDGYDRTSYVPMTMRVYPHVLGIRWFAAGKINSKELIVAFQALGFEPNMERAESFVKITVHSRSLFARMRRNAIPPSTHIVPRSAR